MIRFERTRDYALVADIMSHPRIYEGISDDFYPPAEHFRPLESESLIHLLVFDEDKLLGLFITHPINYLTWEVHHALLPSAWGARAAVTAALFEDWMWEFTPALTLVGFTPTSNPLAIAYAQRQGWREVGRISRCYQKRSELYDLVVLQKHKPERTI